MVLFSTRTLDCIVNHILYYIFEISDPGMFMQQSWGYRQHNAFCWINVSDVCIVASK